MQEKDFAKILGISHSNYSNLKNTKNKAKILKNTEGKISEEEKEEIIEEILKSRKVKPGQSIDYAYFLELYEPYKPKIKDTDFAEILGISYMSYIKIKTNYTNGRKARILKDREEKSSEEEKEKIVEEILKSRKVKPGQSIDYAYFLELYEPYKPKIKDTDFAELLSISYVDYSNLKNIRKKNENIKR